MSLKYMKSDNISVFPCAYRDPKYKKARFTTEENLTNLTNISDNKSNYLYAYMLNSDEILIYIDGYRFVTTLENLKDDIGIDDLTNKTIYAGIKYNYSVDVGRCLSIVGDSEIPQSSDINDDLEVGVTELDQVKVAQHTILDAGIDPDNLYFGGIAFTTNSADFDSSTRYIALNFDGEGNLSNKILTVDDQNVRNSSSDLPISELFTTKKLHLSDSVSTSGAYIYSKLDATNEESKVIIQDAKNISKKISLPYPLPDSDSYKNPDKRFLWVKQYRTDYADFGGFEDSWIDEKDLKPRSIESDNSKLKITIRESDKNCWGTVEGKSVFLQCLEDYARSFLTLSKTTYSNISDVKLNVNSGIIPISLNISGYGNYNTFKRKLPIGLEKSAVGHISYQYVPYKVEDIYVEAAKCDLILNVISEADVSVGADGAYHVVFYVLHDDIKNVTDIVDSVVWNKWSFNGSMIFNINNESFADTSAQVCLTDLAECFDNSDIKVRFNFNDDDSQSIYSYQLLPLSEYIINYKTVDNYIAMKSFEQLLKKLNPQSKPPISGREDVVEFLEKHALFTYETESTWIQPYSIQYYKFLLLGKRVDDNTPLSDSWSENPLSLPNLSQLQLGNFCVFAKTDSATISKLSYIDFHISNTKSIVKIYENPVYNTVVAGSDNDYANLPYKIFYFDANARINTITQDSEYRLWHVSNDIPASPRFEYQYADVHYDLRAAAWHFDNTVDLSTLSNLKFIIDADNMLSTSFEIGKFNDSGEWICRYDFTALNVDIDNYTSGWYTSNTVVKNLPHMTIDCSEATDFNLNKYIVDTFGLGKSQTQTFELINLPDINVADARAAAEAAGKRIKIGLPGYEYDGPDSEIYEKYNPIIIPKNWDKADLLPDGTDCFELEKYSFIEGTNVVGNITCSSDGALLIELTDVASGNKWSRKKSYVANPNRNGIELKESWSDWRCQGGFIEIPIGYCSSTTDANDPTNPHYFTNAYMNVYKPQRHIEALIRSLRNSMFNIALSGGLGLPAESNDGHRHNDATKININNTTDIVLNRWSYGILTIASSHDATLRISSVLKKDFIYESLLFNISINNGVIQWSIKEAVDQENLPPITGEHYRPPSLDK